VGQTLAYTPCRYTDCACWCWQADEPTYVRYTPNPSAPGYNSNAKQRVIELVDAQVDPLEPSKHKHKKVRPSLRPSPAPPRHPRFL
jgi:hypothetical protein